MSKAVPLSFDFAFEGFRIIRERPKLIAFWGLISLIGNGLSLIILVAFGGPGMETLKRMQESAQGKPVDPTALASVSQQVFPAILMCLPVTLIVSSILTGAVYRATFGDKNDRFGFLKFGLGELNLVVLTLVTILLMLGVMVSCGMVAVIVGAALSSVSSTAPAAVVSLSMIVAIIAILWLQVRLSLNTAQTLATGRLNIFGSFALTREPFWPLVSGYALAVGLMIVVSYLAGKVVEAVLAVAFQTTPASDLAAAHMSSLSAFFTLPNIVFIVMSYGIISPLLSAIIIGAPMAAYKALGGDRAMLKPENA